MSTVANFCLCAATILIYFQNRGKKAQTQFFLTFLLVPFQTDWQRFCLMGLVDLTLEQTISRAVGGAMSIGRKVVLDYI